MLKEILNSGFKGSVIRIPVQIVLTTTNKTKAIKIARQSSTEIKLAPSKVATAGTNENMIMIKDDIRAISRPEYRSRIKAWETTRGAAAPIPWKIRATTIVSRLGANMQNEEETIKMPEPK